MLESFNQQDNDFEIIYYLRFSLLKILNRPFEAFHFLCKQTWMIMKQGKEDAKLVYLF